MNPKTPGQGRRNKWLARHPKIAPFYTTAINMLSTGGTHPSWRSIRKMMFVLAMAPTVRLPGSEIRVPYPMIVAQHKRGSWRSYATPPSYTNLQVGGAA